MQISQLQERIGQGEATNVRGGSLSPFPLNVFEIALCAVGEREVMSTVLIESRDDRGQVVRGLRPFGHLTAWVGGGHEWETTYRLSVALYIRYGERTVRPR